MESLQLLYNWHIHTQDARLGERFLLIIKVQKINEMSKSCSIKVFCGNLQQSKFISKLAIDIYVQKYVHYHFFQPCILPSKKCRILSATFFFWKSLETPFTIYCCVYMWREISVYCVELVMVINLEGKKNRKIYCR